MARPKAKKSAPRRKPTPVVELLPPEETAEPPQVREVKHKTEWVELEPIEETPPDEEIDFEEIEESDAKPSKKKDEREELRKILVKNNVTNGSNLRLHVERYLHSETAETGHWAESEFLTKYAVTKEHITNEDYLDVARKWGPGTYRFCLRMNHKVVAAWDKRVGVATSAAAAVNEPVAPGAPPDVAAQPIGVIDPIKQLRESAKMYKELKEAFEVEPPPAEPQSTPTDPEVAAWQLLAKNPEVMERLGKGIASTIFGARNIDSDPWADVFMKALETGQASQIIGTAIHEIMAPFREMKGAQNGAPPQQPIRPAPFERPLAPPDVPGPQAPQQPQSVQAANQPPQLNEADALVISLIKACEQKAPAQDAVNIINVACYRTPELGESVDALINMSPESLLAMLAAYHPDVAKWEHAKQWLKDLTDALTAGEEAGE